MPSALPRSSPVLLSWQSRLVLVAVLTPAAFYAIFSGFTLTPRTAASALAISLGFAALVWLLRAAGPAAALFGALLTFCFAALPAYPHSAVWLLLLTLVLTLGAGRVGRRRKLAAAPEEKHARTSAQVAANLGVAALCGTLVNSQGMLLAHAALTAALAETTSDTLASELGRLARSQPRMLLGGRRMPPGTDGAISLPGTAAGLGGAAALCAAGAWAFALPFGVALAAFGAAIFGLFLDSLLGQLLERRGLLNNDAVNFLSNAAAAVLAMAILRVSG